MTTLLRGDCRAVLPTLGASSFQTVVTSPPYWEQREYLPKEHPDKALEIGHEHTAAEYVASLVVVFREVKRVLHPTGTLWVNLGDKYATPAGKLVGGKVFRRQNALARRGAIPDKLVAGRAGVRDKNLLGLPWRLALALQDDGWILRSEIIWEKPNAKPSSVKDRPVTAHEHVFLLSRRETYVFNPEALREPGATQDSRLGRTVWRIITEPGNGVHVAPMPRELARRCIVAGSRPGDAVLDPFGGSGTVGVVAELEGRKATLIDLDEAALGEARMRTVQPSLGVTA